MLRDISGDGDGLKLSYVVPVYFDQRDATTLVDLLRRYSGYAKEIRRQIEFIIVDDCSPLPLQIPVDLPLNLSLLRITTDIRWNQCGARNLGVVYARSRKLILSDIDHFFTEDLLAAMVKKRLAARTLYKFKRVDGSGRPIKKAMNIFFLSRALFFDGLGYDEEFCGNYGYEDLFFLALQRRLGTRIRYFSRRKKIVASKVDRSRSYHSLTRDKEVNWDLYCRKKELLRQKDPLVAHSRKFLGFSWEKILERSL